MDTTRRSFLGLLGFIAAAPVIVRAASLMPVKSMLGLDEITSFKFEFDRNNDLYRELAAVTRRAFVPETQVQLYRSNPLFVAMMDEARRNNPGGIDRTPNFWWPT